MIHSLVLYWCVHVFTFKLGAGAYAGCTYCCIKGEYSKNLQKIIYLDHRFFLPRIDSLRTTHKNFPSKSVPDHPPSPKTMDFVSDKITDLSKPMISRERKDMLQNSGCTGDYLRRLPFHDRFLNTPVEPMHLLKNISERIVKLLSGLRDTLKVRLDEKERKRFCTSWPKTNEDGNKLSFLQRLSVYPRTSFLWQTNVQWMLKRLLDCTANFWKRFGSS